MIRIGNDLFRTNSLILIVFILTGFITKDVSAQDKEKVLSLQEVIALNKAQNISVKIAETESAGLTEDFKDAKQAVLPTITTGGSYQRYSRALFFEDGLGGIRSAARRPGQNGANLNMEASFNVFSGGKTNALIEEQQIRKDLGKINIADQSGSSSLQVTAHYLDLVRQYDLRQIIADQIKRAHTRLRNVNSLYKNQRVTKSDVLRAELGLSNAELNKVSNDNDITILHQKINVLLNIDESSIIIPADSADTPRPSLAMINEILGTVEENAYDILKADKNIKIQSAKVKAIKSNYYPSVSLISSYGFNYPNALFYPPIDQLYSIGYVGARITYNLSSLYQNKHKYQAGKIRLSGMEQQKQLVQRNTNQKVQAYLIKYKEALNRVEVMKKSISQAVVNYRIVNTKYLNQLALLTDLLDADNLLQEARFSLSTAQTNASLMYYHILYTSGNL